MIPVLQDIAVRQKGWFTEEEALDIIAVCQTLPGVVAINMATFVGFRKRGLPGSLVATTGIILPSFFIILLIAKGLANIRGNPWVLGALGGLRAAALGLILIAVWKVGGGVMKDAFSTIGAVVSFLLIAVLHVPVVRVVLLFLVIGVVRAMYLTKRSGGGSE